MKWEWDDCNVCSGTGQVKAPNLDDGWIKCGTCKGRGQVKVPVITDDN